MKQSYEKSKFLEILSDNPWISFASKKSGIARATIYRWMKDKPDFRHAVEDALKTGNSQLDEIAEMGLTKKIREGNLNAIKYYLDHNNPRYIKKAGPYFPPLMVHEHSSDSEVCEICIRAQIEREAKKKLLNKEIDEAIGRLLNPKTKAEKDRTERLMNDVAELGRRHGENRK